MAKIRNEQGALGIECEEIELHKLLQNLKKEIEQAVETYENTVGERKTTLEQKK